MAENTPIILVTNDDGITAPGIRALIQAVKDFGKIVVVAPDKPQSAQGHALTLNEPLRLRKVDIFGDIEAYECSGTPVDCVKLAKDVVLENRAADICVSGINHGSNASINIIYSGTVSAAMEASLEGINSIGFSLLDFARDADFEPAKKYVRHLVRYVLENGLQQTKLLNVNIPKLPTDEIKGIKICRQADAKWVEKFARAKDPHGRDYYWLTGEFTNPDKGEDTDIWALENGYVSIVPSQHDLTAYGAIEVLKGVEVLNFAKGKTL